MRLVRGLLLKPTLNLLTWILKRRDGNSLVGGGPLGWSWYSTLAAMATDHHGDMTAFGGTHHAHSQLGGVTADQHHAQDHAARHQDSGADEISIAGLSGEPADVVAKSLFDAQTILIAVTDNTPVALAVAASRIVGRKSTGNIVALTGAELMAILSGQAGAAFSMNSQRMTTLGTPTSAGDALRKGTRITTSELPTLTTDKIWKGVAGVPAEADLPVAGIWTLLETLSPNNVASITSSTLTAYDMFMILYRLEVLNTGVSAALCMRLNGDTGNSYTRLLLDMSGSPPVWYCWAADKFKLSQHYSTNKYGAGVVYFPGNLGTSQIPIATSSGFVYTGYHWIAAGKYSASANIITITFLGEGTNITGKIAIYGKNFA